MDHDGLFKLLLTHFFFEFVEAFLPGLAPLIDPRSIEFLDKETIADIGGGEKHIVDLLVRVRFRGPDAKHGFFIIHLENQATSRRDFARRMFRYFARLREKFNLPVYPVAIFSFGKPLREEPDSYVEEFPDLRVLDFRFRSIQLNRMSWREFVDKPNAAACALMTKMKIDPKDRPRVKLQCVRMLATLKLDPAKSMLISAFMNSYLKLSDAETARYNREVEAIEPKEREVVMQLTNEWIEEGIAKGLEKGIEKGIKRGKREGRLEGLLEGRRQVVLQLLTKKFGPGSVKLMPRINALTESRLDQFAVEIMTLSNVAAASRWLTQHT